MTKYPLAGGAAVFAQRAFGKPLLSFLTGFAMMSGAVTAAASLAVAFAGDYLAQFVTVPSILAALVFMAVVAVLNLRGVAFPDPLLLPNRSIHRVDPPAATVFCLTTV